MIVATALLVFACSGSFLWLNMTEHEAIYKRTVFGHLDALSRNMSDDLVPLIADQDMLAITTKLLDFERYKNIQYSIVYDREWNVMQTYVAPSFMTSLTGKTGKTGKVELPPFNIKTIDAGLSIRKGSLVSYSTIGDQAFLQGYLLIVNQYRTPLNKSHYALFVSSSPVAFFILCCMMFLAVFFNRSMLSPLFRLTKFTESINSSTNYHLRFDCKGNDEISSLGEKINAMLSRIEAQDEKNAEYTAALEDNKNTLEQMANYDALTELPNRKLFMELLRGEISRAKRRSTNVIVLFLNLDDFKGINDTLGHAAGDALLIKVASLIKVQLREGDVLARIGGDEFLVLLNDIPDDILDVGIKIIERIVRAFDLPVMVHDWEVQTGASIGFSDGINSNFDPDTIVRNADIAMHHAKTSGRSNTFTVFQQQQLDDSLRKSRIANAFTKSLLDNEFFIAYQSKVGVNAEVVGLEALIRWDSHFCGFISPMEFIPVAERSGKITHLSRWVINKVFEDLSKIFEIVGKEVVVSINISAYDIKEPKFVEYIQHELTLHDVDPKSIEFEITESAYLDNFEEAANFFQTLRRLGFSIALDDFGTGYSSMSYLTRIEIDTLKIDQQFIKRLDESAKDQLIVEAIISLARGLELDVCAEGVETLEQSNYLVHHGCQQLQGYYYARPCALDKLKDQVNGILDISKFS